MEETTDKPRSERAREAFSALLGDWRELLSKAVDEAETFTREKPAAGLTAAFVAGLVFGSFFRRR